MANIDPRVLRQLPKVPEGIDVEWKLKVSGTVETDKRVMTFVDNLWGIEVTGGIDQFEPLTIISVKKTGLARRAGIRVGDVITKINNTPADQLTLLEAQMEIHESGKSVKIFVKGDELPDDDDDMTVDFWFKPLSRKDLDLLEWEKRRALKRLENQKLYEGFPWNDRRKRIYTESNCFMVPSLVLEKQERMIKLKATREEYIESLKAKAAELQAEKEAEEEARKLEEELAEEEEMLKQEQAEQQANEEQTTKQEQPAEQQFETIVLASTTNQTNTTEEFSKIVAETTIITQETSTISTLETETTTEITTETQASAE